MEKKLTKAQRKDRRNRELCKLVKENNLLAENRLLMENEGLIVQLASRVEVLYDIDINNWGGVDDDSCNIRTTFLKHADKIPETFGQDS